MSHEAPQVSSTESDALGKAVGSIARRSFVFLGLGALAACTSTGRQLASSSSSGSGWAPGPVWPGEVGKGRPSYAASHDDDATEDAVTKPAAATGPRELATSRNPAVLYLGARPRTEWAMDVTAVALVNPMLPVKAITIHHDGIPTVFWGEDVASSEARIEFIRRAHRNKGWGDIGYHVVIDRAGRVWEGRPLQWQGAHVKNHNEGNIGILVMGNFEVQQPTQAQLASLDKVVRTAKSHWKVSRTNLKSHREWSDAATSCPGKNLQGRWNSIRAKV